MERYIEQKEIRFYILMIMMQFGIMKMVKYWIEVWKFRVKKKKCRWFSGFEMGKKIWWIIIVIFFVIQIVKQNFSNFELLIIKNIDYEVK